jgi:acyl-CoA ligase (AMP-forming) (exosortase A-associated)
MRTSLHHMLEERGSSDGDGPALTYRDRTWTYAELWDTARRVGGGLTALGLVRDDRVAVFLDKRLETVASIFGTSAAGGVFVPVNPLLRPQQVGYILRDCSVSIVITTRERLQGLMDELTNCPSLEHVVVVGDEPDDGAQGATGRSMRFATHRWIELTSGADEPVPHSAVDLDIGAILYTSGSTGMPKGVVLSHRNLIVGGESVSQYIGNASDDVILSALPLSFDAGFSQLTTAFNVGAHVVLMNYLLPVDVVRLCARHRVTGLTCVPPLWIQIAEQEWPEDVGRRLRYFANTGGRMPRPTLDKLRSLFPMAKPFLMYGLTEAFRSTYLDPSQVDQRPDSIGKAIPNAEILVVRPDGSRCEPGEEGELVHRGPLVALGYWNDPERTAERFRPTPGQDSSWRTPEIAVWSGDTVVSDEEGYLFFVGRADEMIKSSGYRVSPTEVEEAAYATGLVRDVVALGLEDAVLGQRIALVATPKHDTVEGDDVITAMKRRLPLYMVPSLVDLRDEIPRSPNGKFDRASIREQFRR